MAMDELEKLFGLYKNAIPDPDASAHFLPGMWSRIESRRPPLLMLKRWARVLVTSAAAAVLLMTFFLIPRYQRLQIDGSTYVDVLAADDLSESEHLAYTQPDDRSASEAPYR